MEQHIIYQLLITSLFICLKYTTAIQKPFSILSTPSTEERVVECIAKQFERYHVRYGIIVSTFAEINGAQWRSKSGVTIINYDGIKLLESLKIFKILLILVDTIDQFEVFMKYISQLSCWNPRGKFIVTIFKIQNITQIFEVAWRYYVVNINVVHPEELTPMVYTYFPYNSTDCSVNLSPQVLFSCDEKFPISLFPDKIPNHGNGCELKLIALSIPPYVINVNADRGNPTLAGLEVTIMHTFTKMMNFTERYIPHNFTHWGTAFPNGTNTNMYKIIEDQKADFMFGMTPFDVASAYQFECTSIYVFEKLIWWVPMAEELPRWKNLLKIYQPFVWYLILVTFFVNGLVWWIFGRSLEQSSSYRQWYKSVIASWSVLLQISYEPPKSNVTRILFLFWTIFSLLLNTCHQSVLVSTLTRPHYEYQMKTIEELVNSKLGFGFFPIIANSFNDSNSWVDRKIVTNYIKCPVSEECLNRTAFKRDFAVVKNLRQTIYLTNKYYLYPNKKPMIYGFKEGIMYIPKYVVATGYPFLEMFDYFILRMQAYGLIHKWDQDITYQREYKDENQLHALTTGHLLLPIVILMIGLTVSFIVLLLEILVKKVCKIKDCKRNIYYTRKSKEMISKKYPAQYPYLK